MRDVPCFSGIDVAKAQGDIALRPSGARWAVPNDVSGVTLRVDQLQPLHPTLIVLEASGGLERLVTSTFYQRLLAAGKVTKVALTACMHKFLTILNAMLKHRTPWQAQEVQH